MLSFLKQRVWSTRGTAPPQQQPSQQHQQRPQQPQFHKQQARSMEGQCSGNPQLAAAQRSSGFPARLRSSAVRLVRTSAKAPVTPVKAVEECYICFEPIHRITEKALQDKDDGHSTTWFSVSSSPSSSSSSLSSSLPSFSSPSPSPRLPPPKRASLGSPGPSTSRGACGGPSSSTEKTTFTAKISISFECGKDHQYCLHCLAQYVKTEVEAKRWPVCCPSNSCTRQISAKVIEAALGEDALQWHMLGVEHAISNKLYCPNKVCNVMLELDPRHGNETVECPYCKESICTTCLGKGHRGKTCAQVTTSFETENEAAFHRLAKAEEWSQCPNCKQTVERISGCNHMKCRCRQEYCHRCNGAWPCRKKCT